MAIRRHLWLVNLLVPHPCIKTHQLLISILISHLGNVSCVLEYVHEGQHI